MAVTPKGSRRLGVYVRAPESGDYATSFAQARSWGMELTTLALDWGALEPSPGTYDDTWLTIAEAFYPPNGVALDLILRPINTNQVEVPADLAGLAWDHASVVSRFEDLVEFVLGAIPSVTLNALVIGNEVDAYLGTDAGAYAAYRTFFEAARDAARAIRPGLAVGVAAQAKGLLGASTSGLLAGLNADADAIVATYYPFRADGTYIFRRPSEVAADLDALAGLDEGRPIVVTEAGYASGPACGGSPVLQAAFVRALFRAWDDHADRIPSITLSWQGDLAPAEVAAFGSYYGIDDPAFLAFLGTLGLRTWEGPGADKLAVRALRWHAAARGW